MKSQVVALIAPICTAACIITSVRLGMKGVVQNTPLSRQGGSTHKNLAAMEVALQNALDNLDQFRQLYDDTLG